MSSERAVLGARKFGGFELGGIFSQCEEFVFNGLTFLAAFINDLAGHKLKFDLNRSNPLVTCNTNEVDRF
jgi:hypothetical protein